MRKTLSIAKKDSSAASYLQFKKYTWIAQQHSRHAENHPRVLVVHLPGKRQGFGRLLSGSGILQRSPFETHRRTFCHRGRGLHFIIYSVEVHEYGLIALTLECTGCRRSQGFLIKWYPL